MYDYCFRLLHTVVSIPGWRHVSRMHVVTLQGRRWRKSSVALTLTPISSSFSKTQSMYFHTSSWSLRLHAWTHTIRYTHVSTHTRMHARMHAHTHTQIELYTHTHTHTHTHTDWVAHTHTYFILSMLPHNTCHYCRQSQSTVRWAACRLLVLHYRCKHRSTTTLPQWHQSYLKFWQCMWMVSKTSARISVTYYRLKCLQPPFLATILLQQKN